MWPPPHTPLPALVLALALSGAVGTTTPRGPLASAADDAPTPPGRAEVAGALAGLMTFYDATTGLWGDPKTPWWHSGVALQALVDWMEATGGGERQGGVLAAAENTFPRQRRVLPWWPEGGGDFRADSTDDTAWWALAALGLWRVVTAATTTNGGDGDGGEGEREEYRRVARGDEAYIWRYWDGAGACGGGLVWNIPRREYHNAISNELYLDLAASLANSLGEDGDGDGADHRAGYVGRAQTEWEWFRASGMINEQSLINDGLAEEEEEGEDDGGKCRNNGDVVWTYNQGVVLGGLAELARATASSSPAASAAYLAEARAVADAVLASPDLTTTSGTLTEPGCASSADACAADAWMFKGVFMRGLRRLDDAVGGDPAYRAYLRRNARQLWDHARNATVVVVGGGGGGGGGGDGGDGSRGSEGEEVDFFAGRWQGPFDGVTVASQVSALLALIAAMDI